MKRNFFCIGLLATVTITGCNAQSADSKAMDSDTGAAKSLVSMASPFSVKETADKLDAILRKKGLTVFGRLNHAGNAKRVGLELRPTEIVFFGNPKVGTPLMNCAQSVAIDLPQKMLIWQDEQDKVWLAYNNPEYLKQRHNIEGCDKVLGKITNVLGALGKAATSE